MVSLHEVRKVKVHKREDILVRSFVGPYISSSEVRKVLFSGTLKSRLNFILILSSS
jgi:hypothetical protein